jgi:Tfp pilus assembly PilM family ATPase
MKSFLDLFPVPKFLEMPFVGISVTDSAIRFVEFSKHNGKMKLLRFAEKELPLGVINSGYVNNKEAVIAILKEFKKKYKLNFVKATVPEEKAYSFKTKIPVVEKGENRSAVEFNIEENVPLSLSESIFDFTVISGKERNDYAEAVVTVLPTKVVETYLELYEAAELNVLQFDTESHAVCRAVIKEGDDRVYLVLNLDKTKIGFYIVKNGIVEFSSAINTKTDILFSENYQKPITAQNEALVVPKASNNPVLKDEIDKIFAYWNARGDGTKISKVILCGENKYAELIIGNPFNLGINFEKADVWSNAFSLEEYIPEISLDNSLRFSAAIGLALPNNR